MLLGVNDAFVPAQVLNAGFYRDVVAPAVSAWPHRAALLGHGSEVLGYDTFRSTDHGWGLRLQVFVDDPLVAEVRAAVDAALPDSYRGRPVRYGWDDVPVMAHVTVGTLGRWLRAQLGIDPRPALEATDWLLVPQQRLLGVVRGAVYRDDGGELATVRDELAWYPHDVWLWLLACQWRRLAQEEPFAARAAEVGDALGAAVVTARLARELMRIWFLLEREYWPYTKWFGTAFSRLPGTEQVGSVLHRAVTTDDHPSREAALAEAYELTAARFNVSGLTEPLDPRVRSFHARGYLVLEADRFADACRSQITDPRLRALPLVGSVDQFVDGTDVLDAPDRARRLRALFSDSSTRRGRAIQ